MRLGAVVLDSENPQELADFYHRLLGWKKEVQGEWIVLINPLDMGAGLVFQQSQGYLKPVWPAQSGKPQQMMHLDFYVSKDQYAQQLQHCINCGATLNPHQLEENWTVLLDPAGHPFCLLKI